MPRRRGLGQVVGEPISASNPSVVYTGLGTSVDCSQLGQWITNPGPCWGYSLAAWKEMNAVSTAVGPMPSPPVVPAQSFGFSTNPPAPTSGAQASGQITDVLLAQHEAQTQSLQNYFGQAATALQKLPTNGTGTNWLMWALIGGGALILILAIRR